MICKKSCDRNIPTKISSTVVLRPGSKETHSGSLLPRRALNVNLPVRRIQALVVLILLKNTKGAAVTVAAEHFGRHEHAWQGYCLDNECRVTDCGLGEEDHDLNEHCSTRESGCLALGRIWREYDRYRLLLPPV